MKTAIVLALVSIAVAVDLKAEFEQYKKDFGKEYLNAAENTMRFEIFTRIYNKIQAHNERFDAGEETFEMGLTRFSDLTKEEQKRVLGYKLSGERTPGITFLAPENIELPASVDWRTKGYVTGIKDQADCGSCWAFSATGSLEGQHFKKAGKLVSLSEQNLVDCVTADDGCDGGLMDDAFDYIKSNKGVDTEASYPYEATDGSCRFKKANVGATDSGRVDIKSGSESELQKAVATIGPVSVAINANTDEFMNYKKGLLKIADCPGGESDLDHGVLAVGYGMQNGTKGGAYWIVKNSWGTDWGMKGYVLMARNFKNMCGIATASSYPTV